MKKLHIDIYSHFFKVSRVHPTIYVILLKALNELIQRQFVKIRGRVQQQSVKVYATKLRDSSEYRFHLNYYTRFMEHLHGHGINDAEITITRHDLYEPAEIDVKLPEHIQLRDYQQAGIDYIAEDGVSKIIPLHPVWVKPLQH